MQRALVTRVWPLMTHTRARMLLQRTAQHPLVTTCWRLLPRDSPLQSHKEMRAAWIVEILQRLGALACLCMLVDLEQKPRAEGWKAGS